MDHVGETHGLLELQEHDVTVMAGGVVVGVDEGFGRVDALLRPFFGLQAVVAHADGDGAGQRGRWRKDHGEVLWWPWHGAGKVHGGGDWAGEGQKFLLLSLRSLTRWGN